MSTVIHKAANPSTHLSNNKETKRIKRGGGRWGGGGSHE
jgi:hypothetical protein